MFSLESLYKSLLRRIEEIRAQIISSGISTNMKYYAWDSRGEDTELGNTDLIGLVGWSYEENEGLPVIQAGVLVSMIVDQNQFREVRVMDVIRNSFVGSSGDFKTIGLFDNTATEYGQLQVSNFEIMPAGRSEIRSTRNVAIEFLRATGDR